MLTKLPFIDNLNYHIKAWFYQAFVAKETGIVSNQLEIYCAPLFINWLMAHWFWRLIIITVIGLMPVVIYAESVRFVHWWDAYVQPQSGGPAYQSNGLKSVQYQDVNKDGIYNDALVWYDFTMDPPLSPLSRDRPDSEKWHKYSHSRVSAIFYGGVVARFTNISHLTKRDRKGNIVPFFDRFQQATVQKSEGGRPCSYSDRYPHHIARGWDEELGAKFADMTVMVVNCCSPEFSEKFHQTKEAEVNFTSVFLWKKEDFINGGATVVKITFDETSKLSVDVTRFRENVEEGRFVIQENEQLWISEAAIILNDADEEEPELSIGIKGMNVTNFKYGAVVELNPLNSRWAIYTPLPDQERVDSLLESLNTMAFNPKKASDEETQSYQNQSDELLEQVNKMEFNPQTANFVEHTFEDVQAVGVYFATYQFAHKTTQLVFDNFQAYAVGPIPKAQALAIKQGQLVDTQTSLSGGISVNCGPYEQTVRQCEPDLVTIQGNLLVDSADIGKSADIVAVASHKPAPEPTAEPQIFYMLGNEGKVIEEWDGNLDNLIAFQDDIVLTTEQSIQIYQGQIPLTGFIQIFFGYRLPDGTLIYNPQSIDTLINPENTSPRNDMQYSESIKGLCSVNN
jgi:hypothetical protein